MICNRRGERFREIAELLLTDAWNFSELRGRRWTSARHFSERDIGKNHIRGHIAFIGETFALTGDLDGTRGARSIPGPSDEAAWATSRERVAGLVPRDRWLAGHPQTIKAV
jgi:hypothetical protein